MRMCIRARDTSYRRKGVYTYAHVVIRLYYIDKGKNRECVRSERASERAKARECACVSVKQTSEYEREREN